MLKKLGRALTSFLVVVMAFGVYSFAVVPLVERPTTSGESVKKAVAIAQLVTGRTATDQYVRELSKLGFPADSWELQKPTVLRSPQMTILLKDFTQQSDGSLHIRPCTLVHYANGRDDKDRKRGPTIMRAPEGAILYFDRKIDLKKFSFDAKISGGKLVGDIQIISVGGRDSEDFQLVTRDVEILDKRIFTREFVKVQMGKTYMQGQELTLTRNQDAREEDSAGSYKDSLSGTAKKSGDDDGFDWMSELSHFSLRRLDVLRVETEEGDLFKSFANRPDPQVTDERGNSQSESKQAPTVLEVACSGPIHFDLRHLVATVEDNVTITHQVQNKPVDTLRAEQLSLHFVRQSKAKQSVGQDADRNADGSQPHSASSALGGKVVLEGKGDSGLALNRIVAFGRPLVIDAKSEGAYVETRHLEHNFASNRIKLRSYNPFAPRPNVDLAKPVVIRNEDHQISAPAIDYIGGANLAATWVVAQGAGQYIGRVETDDPDGEPSMGHRPPVGGLSAMRSPSAGTKMATIIATWTDRLSLQPYDDQQVLKIEGNATVRSPEFGGVQSDNVELWLKLHQVATSIEGKPVNKVLPLRLVSYGNDGEPTSVRSPQLSGNLKSLTVNFVSDPTADSNRPGRNEPKGLSGRRSDGRLGLNGNGLTSSKDAKEIKVYRIEGGDVAAWVDPNARTLQRLSVIGKTTVTEASPTDELPLRIESESIEYQADALGRPIVRVTGTPAQLQSPKLQVTGTDIQLRADQNRIHIPGSGEMQVLYSPDMVGQLLNENAATSTAPAAVEQPSKEQWLKFQWSRELQFDGQTAQLLGEVTAIGEDLAATTHDLEVVLKQPINFAELIETEQVDLPKPELARVTSRNAIVAGMRHRDEAGNVESYQQIVTQNMNVDFVSGELFANGPGWFAYTTPPDKLPDSFSPSAFASRSPSARSKPTKPKTGLQQVSLNFAKQLRANILRRELVVFDNVQGWMGPVKRWEDRIDPAKVTELGEEEYRIACNQLSVYESPTAAQIDPSDPKSRKPIELIADQGAYVEGQLYSARGEQITFVEEKGLLSMKGNERRLAEFWQRNSVDELAAPVTGKARRIQYNLKTGKMDATLSDVEIDLTQAPSALAPARTR